MAAAVVESRPPERRTTARMARLWVRGGEESGGVPLELQPHARAVEVIGVTDPYHAHRDGDPALTVDRIEREHALLADLDEELRGQEHASGPHVRERARQHQVPRRQTCRGYGCFP